MQSIREQIMQAVVAAINQDGKPDSVPTCMRANMIGSNPEQLPRMSVYPAKEEVARVNRGAIVRRVLILRVECHAIGLVGEDAADAMVDSMLAWTTKCLAGNNLGGLVNSIEETALEWAMEPQDYAYCAAVQDFAIEYQTIFNDPTRR